MAYCSLVGTSGSLTEGRRIAHTAPPATRRNAPAKPAPNGACAPVTASSDGALGPAGAAGWAVGVGWAVGATDGVAVGATVGVG